MARKFTAADVEITAKDKTKPGVDSAKGGLGGLTSAVKRYGVEMAAVGAAIAVAIKVVKNLTDAYAVQEKAEIRLAAAIRVIGGDVDSLMGQYKKFASDIQRVTTLGDEQVLMLLQQAQSFGIAQDQMEEATRGAIGLSKAFGIDMNTALRGVANAFEGNYTQLSRYIPALRSAGTEAEKQAVLQKAMADGFAIAQAETQTWTGSMEQLKNAIGDLKEVGGKALADFLKPGIKLLTEFVTNTTNAIKETQRLKKIAEEMAKGQVVAAKDAAAVIREQIKALETRIEMEKRLQIDPGIAQEEMRMLKERLAAFAEAARWEAIEATEREKGNKAAAAAAAEAAQRQRDLVEWIEMVNAAYDKTEQGQRDILLAEIAKWEYEFSRSQNYRPQIQVILDMLYKQRDANKEIKETVEDAIIVFDKYGRVIEMASINVDNFADMEERARGTVKALTDAIKEQGEETEEQKKKQQEMLSIATQAVTAFGQTFAETAMEGGKVFKEAMKAAIASVVEALAAVEAGRAAAAFMTLNVVKGGMHMAAAALLYTTAAAIRALEKGGWITEPVIGKGLRTGTTYTLAEKGPEYVLPPDKMGPGGTSIIHHHHYHIRGSMITERQLIEKTAAAVAKALSYGY